MSHKSSVYFEGLDGMRFIAACSVILTHVEQIKSHFSLSNYYHVPFFRNVGDTAVTFFFVLSGFLITYLLFAEKREKEISVRMFYMRRFLRIWPLYFTIVIIAFFLLPRIGSIYPVSYANSFAEDYYSYLIMYVVFAPNVALVLKGAFPYASHLWSIGVEEQFYVIWPWVIKYSRRIFVVMLMIISGIFIIRNSAFIVGGELLPQYEERLAVIGTLLDVTRIGCMSIGGVGAYIVLYYKDILRLVYSKTAQAVVITILAVLIVNGQQVPFINSELYGALFAVLIINVSTNPHSLLKLKSKKLRYLGNMSYGIYMYHPIVIGLVIVGLSYVVDIERGNVLTSLLTYGLVFSGTTVRL